MTNRDHPAAIYERNLDEALDGKYLKVASLLSPESHVLELGCATGYFAAALTRLGHDVTGLEGDVDAVELCRQRGVRATAVDLSAAEPFDCVGGQKFDAVLAMDLLEHLPRPQQLLKALPALLNPAGKLIITGPNVAYWNVRLKLLLGRWDYAASGIMDETHLRWFTRRTWRKMIENAGFTLDVDEPAEAMLPYEQCLKMLGCSQARIQSLRLAVARSLPTLFTTVFVFSATLANSKPRLPVLT